MLLQFNIKVNIIHMILLCQVHLYICSSAHMITINGTFKECIVDAHLPHLQFDQFCFEINEERILQEITNKTYNILKMDSITHFENEIKPTWIFAKHDNVLEAVGYECSRKRHIYIYETDFFFQTHTDYRVEYDLLEPSECETIYEHKKCGSSKMHNCENQTECYYRDPEPEKKFPFWKDTNIFTLFECRYHRRTLISTSLTSQVLPNAISHCLPMDYFCQLQLSTVVWKPDEVRTCPFERIELVDDLKRYQHIRPSDNPFKMIVTSQKKGYAFAITSYENQLQEQNQCRNVTFLPTAEGFYLGPVKNERVAEDYLKLRVSKIKSTHIESMDFRKFNYAHEDFTELETLDMIKRLHCSTMLNTIRNNQHKQDHFLIVNEMAYGEFVVYINNGLAYLPQCRTINSINVLTETNKCYKHFAIQYKNKPSMLDMFFNKTKTNNTVNGFIRPNGIVTRYSYERSCDSYYNNDLYIDNNTTLIGLKQKGKKVIITNATQSLQTKLKVSYTNDFIAQLLHHNELIYNETGIFEIINEVEKINDGDDMFYVKKDDDDGIIDVFSEKHLQREGGAVAWFAKMLKMFHIVVFVTGITILTIVALIILYKMGICCSKFQFRDQFNRLHSNYKTHGFSRNLLRARNQNQIQDDIELEQIA